MKKNILIFLIIASSFIAGILWAYGLLKFFPTGKISHTTPTKKILEKSQEIQITDLENSVTQLVKKVWPSTVNIIIEKDISIFRNDPFDFFQLPQQEKNIQQIWGWSGFFISNDGKIMTNKHVITDTTANYIVVTQNGEEYEAEILGVDPLQDIAILQIDIQESTPLEILSEHANTKIGQFVIAIGNALAEFENSVSFWIISGKNRSIETSQWGLANLLQTDTAINPGNSGWPLINLEGKVIGVNTAIAWNAQGLGFAIPMTQERVAYLLTSLEKFGEIQRPFIGIRYTMLHKYIAKQNNLPVSEGAYILENPIENSSAEKAGIEEGDIILEVNNEPLSQKNSLLQMIQNNIPWDKIEIKILKKNGEEKNLSLTLGSS